MRRLDSPPIAPPRQAWDTGGVAADSWSPGQYARFASERAQPFWDLAALVEPLAGGAVVDLGCGTGELTRALHERSGAGETVGVDSSARMLARAPGGDGLRFELADIRDFQPPGPLALVFSNAALQWLGDHRALFARLRSWLAPGGQLAVQMPDNMDAITHRTAAELAGDPRFAPYLEGAERRGAILGAEEYAVLLHELGFARQTVVRRIYAHLLPGREDVVEWFRGSLLTEYRRLLPAGVYEEFEASYRAALLPRLDDRRPYLLPFPRLLMWARL
jgi:trans-aconitate 2-methyltransferase